MELDADKILEHAIKDGIRDGIKDKLKASYNNPFDKLLSDTISAKSAVFRSLLDEAMAACLSNDEFRAEIKTAVRHSLAKTLVARFGGELEKQVNVLKSDPATRARITLAIEQIVAEKAT